MEQREDKGHLLGTPYNMSRSEQRECFHVILLVIRHEENTQEAVPWPYQSRIPLRDKSKYWHKVAV